MSSLVLTGSTSGTVSVQAPAVAGSNTATLAAATGTHYPFTSGTAVASTSGTSIDFTGIPSWVKRITVMFKGVSTNGTSNYLVQLGAGSVTTTGYLGTSSNISTAVTSTAYTTGLGINNAAGTSSFIVQGNLVVTLLDSNSWTSSGVFGGSDASRTVVTGGGVTLSGTLDRVRITTVNGTDTFDAGSINILYE